MPRGSSVRRTREATPASLNAVLDACLRVLSHHPAALVTDIDGTISRIVAVPHEAMVDPKISAALDALARRLDVVAVITARDEMTARSMVGSDAVTYVGNYGLVAGASLDGVDAIARARADVEPQLAALPCVTVEDKGVAFSLHYRNCPEPEAVRLRLLEILAPIAGAARARILEGKMVLELVPGNLPDKRSALLNIVRSREIKGLVYLGDDLSDIVGFEAIADLRAAGQLAAVGIAVEDAETRPEVAAAADIRVGGVDQVGDLLSQLVTRLEVRTQGMTELAGAPQRLLTVSNRGPVEHRWAEDGGVEGVPGQGGLATALRVAATLFPATWLSSPLSEVDRLIAQGKAVAPGAEGDHALRAHGPGGL